MKGKKEKDNYIRIVCDEEELKKLVSAEEAYQKKFKALCTGKDLSDPKEAFKVFEELFK